MVVAPNKRKQLFCKLPVDFMALHSAGTPFVDSGLHGTAHAPATDM